MFLFVIFLIALLIYPPMAIILLVIGIAYKVFSKK